MARIAVLGVGFIGSNMIKFLKERGHFVRAVDKSFKKERSALYKYADEVASLDLRDLKSCLLATEGMDYVIALAANMGGVSFFHEHDYYPYQDNMEIDMNTLRACELNKIKRLFYSSSACIYPTYLQMIPGKPFKLYEGLLDKPAEADQMYGWEKLMMTKLCERAPFDARVGILHSVYGEYQETEGERMKFPTSIATKMLEYKRTGKVFEVWGDGNQIRSFCYIDDALEKIYRVLMDDKYYGAVNIGSEEAVHVDGVINICEEILGIETATHLHNNTKPTGVLSRNCDNTKFKKYYGYDNKVSTKEGFERLITWIQNKDH